MDQQHTNAPSSSLTEKTEHFLDSIGMNVFQFFAALGNERSSLLCLPADKQTCFMELYDRLVAENSNRTEKGALLEQLSSVLFSSEMFQILRNVHTSSNELDILVTWHERSRLLQLSSSFPCFGEAFICECKNYQGAVSVTYVGKFCALLRLSGIKLGIMISWNGVTGRDSWSDASGLIRKIALKEDIYIIVLDKNDLKKIYECKTNIFSLVTDKHFALQQDIDYSKYIDHHPAENELSSNQSTK